MPLQSFDQMMAAAAAGQTLDIWSLKTGVAAQGAGYWETLWRRLGMPGAGATPAAAPGTNYVGTLMSPVAGAICFPTISGMVKQIVSAYGNSSQSGSLMIYDRLWAVSGISLATTGDRPLNDGSLALPRYPLGFGLWAVAEVTTATTGTAPQVYLKSYRDTLGNLVGPGPTTVFPAAATVADCMVPLYCDGVGFRELRTLTVATAGTAGIVNVALIKPLVSIPVNANVGNNVDLARDFPPMPIVQDGACLGMAFWANGATAPNIVARVQVVYS